MVAIALVLVQAQVLAEPVVLHTAAQEGSAPKFIEADGSIHGHCPEIFRALEKVDPQLRFDIATIGAGYNAVVNGMLGRNPNLNKNANAAAKKAKN